MLLLLLLYLYCEATQLLRPLAQIHRRYLCRDNIFRRTKLYTHPVTEPPNGIWLSMEEESSIWIFVVCTFWLLDNIYIFLLTRRTKLYTHHKCNCNWTSKLNRIFVVCTSWLVRQFLNSWRRKPPEKKCKYLVFLQKKIFLSVPLCSELYLLCRFCHLDFILLGMKYKWSKYWDVFRRDLQNISKRKCLIFTSSY